MGQAAIRTERRLTTATPPDRTWRRFKARGRGADNLHQRIRGQALTHLRWTLAFAVALAMTVPVGAASAAPLPPVTYYQPIAFPWLDVPQELAAEVELWTELDGTSDAADAPAAKEQAATAAPAEEPHVAKTVDEETQAPEIPDNELGAPAGSTSDAWTRARIVRESEQYDVVINVGDDMQALVDSHASGTSFYVMPGIHRMQEVRPKSGSTFQGAPGAIMSGAKLLSSFTRDGSLWVASGQTQGSGSISQGDEYGRCDDGYSACIYPEQLLINDVQLWQVSSKGQVTSGKWYFDYAANKIYFADNPAGKKVETSVKYYAFWGNSNNLTIRGLVMEKYATPGRRGTVNPRVHRAGSNGINWRVENSEIRWNHGIGVKLDDRTKVFSSHLHHNGQMGAGGGIRDVVIEGTEISYNCNAGFKCFGFEGGGVKINTTDDVVLRGNHVHHNFGHGLHTDIYSLNVLVEDNVVTDNVGAGIHHETGGAALIRNNVVERNGLIADAPGILILDSRDTEVTGNVVKNNGDGILARQDSRTSPNKVVNLWVHHNDVTMTGQERSGLRVFINDNTYYTSKNNRFDYNSYDLNYASPTFKAFIWQAGEITPSAWRAAGNDTHGTFE